MIMSSVEGIDVPGQVDLGAFDDPTTHNTHKSINTVDELNYIELLLFECSSIHRFVHCIVCLFMINKQTAIYNAM